MTVLVTGGAGYIGSHAVQALLSIGRKVVVYDNLAKGKRKNIPFGADFILGDIQDKDTLERVIREYRVQAVMHFAGVIDVAESVREPNKYYETNWVGTSVVAHVASLCHVPHFIFSSTAAVYGVPTVTPTTEEGPLVPINPYGVSKMRAEVDVREFYRGKGSHPGRCGTHAILRYFNVAGADPYGRLGYVLEEKPTHLIRTALAVARGQQEHLPVYGTDYPTPDGTCVRDYIHVTDLVDAHIAALNYLEEGGASVTLNCGYGSGYSVLDIVKTVEQVTGKKLPVKYEKRRAGDPPQVVASNALIHKTLAWSPQYMNPARMVEHQWAWECR